MVWMGGDYGSASKENNAPYTAMEEGVKEDGIRGITMTMARWRKGREVGVKGGVENWRNDALTF